MELLCCGKLLGIRKWASLYSSKLLGFRDLRNFEFWQAIGDLQAERPPKALHYRQGIGDSESMQIQRRSKSFHLPASYWGFASGHRVFPASYWGFAICKILSFGKLLGICKRSALLKRCITGKVLGIRNLCKSNAVLNRFTFQQAIGDSQVGIVVFPASHWGFAICEILSLGKLLGICKRSALLKRCITGKVLGIRNLCKSNAVLNRFTFQQAIGDSQSMKLLSCGQAIGHLRFLLSHPVLSFVLGATLPFRFLPEWFPSFVHRRVQRSFCFLRAGFVLGPTLPPSLPA